MCSCVLSVVSRSVCVFVLSLTGVSVSAGVLLCANVLTVRYQSVKGVASTGVYRSCSSARYRRLTAQSTSFGVFVSCLWSDISLCQREMDNIPSTGSVRWGCAVWVDFPHRFLVHLQMCLFFSLVTPAGKGAMCSVFNILQLHLQKSVNKQMIYKVIWIL